MANPISRSLLLAGALVVPAAPSYAALQLAVAVGNQSLTCVDQAACDLNPAVGTLQIGTAQAIGLVAFIGFTQTQALPPLSPQALSNFAAQIINTATSDQSIIITVSATDFVGPVQSLTAFGGGTFTNGNGSIATLQFFGDTANGQGADTPTDTPGTLLAELGPYTSTSPGFAFGDGRPASFVASGPYSLTMVTTLTLRAGDVLTNDVQGLSVGNVSATPVPEPGTLALLAGGLIGFVALTRGRRSPARR